MFWDASLNLTIFFQFIWVVIVITDQAIFRCHQRWNCRDPAPTDLEDPLHVDPHPFIGSLNALVMVQAPFFSNPITGYVRDWRSV